MIAAVVVESVFGHTITSLDDPYVSVARDCTTAVADAAAPAAMLVDYFPICTYIFTRVSMLIRMLNCGYASGIYAAVDARIRMETGSR